MSKVTRYREYINRRNNKEVKISPTKETAKGEKTRTVAFRTVGKNDMIIAIMQTMDITNALKEFNDIKFKIKGNNFRMVIVKFIT